MNGIAWRAQRPPAASFASLYRSTGWKAGEDLDAAGFAKALAGSWMLQAAWRDAELVAVGRVVSDGMLYGLICDLIVDPAHRGRGIGSELLRRLLRGCLEAGLRDVQLFAAEGTAPYYRRFGFAPRAAGAPGMRLVDPAAPGPGPACAPLPAGD